MDDKILIEDDIVDLTDLLEEGNPPSGKSKNNSSKKRINEPDSFDLGKEISMEYEVSVEEIEQDTVSLGPEQAQDKLINSESQVDDFEAKSGKKPLLDIEKEIDMAIQDKFEDVSLTQKEEEMLLKDEPLEESVHDEKPQGLEIETQLEAETITTETSSQVSAETLDTDMKSLLDETVAEKKEETKLEDVFKEESETKTIGETELENLLEDKPVPDRVSVPDDNPAKTIEISEPESQTTVLETLSQVPAHAVSVDTSSFALPVEAVTQTLIEELKKEMPALLESIIRPLVKELLQEVIVGTRDALPSLVEKVIREEIEKLKKI